MHDFDLLNLPIFVVFILGAFHAFEPGHGKAIIAAYMVNSRGKFLDGLLLGLIVTFTHTFSVILLGILATIMSKSFSDAQLHDWLGLISSMLILFVGFWMLKLRLFKKTAYNHVHLFGKQHHCDDNHCLHNPETSHSHDTLHHHHNHDASHHDHNHTHIHDHDHTHDHDHHHETPSKHNKWNLFLLGISGGLVPCPAGIAVLLYAIGEGKISQGISVIISFSLGLGAVMMTMGILFSFAGKYLNKMSSNLEFGRWIGIVSGVIITCLGAYTLYHSIHGLFFVTQ